ncbi:XrtA-associated tyrosine autokinase [Massilia sp. PAMC28688]|uniref:XrtA-associated tyrosine autokinase n=1 Tax=Massilia sp. PAMC28688 TaxID=2861283 RepID=UPI001C634B0F|nr:XrtA-associated tyrosine autokinase [Massilia sp. PAMC28688]QYF95055.1 XrtA-associated tyrosine autokinase [Massilia sp. PAMC28688]
MSIIEKAAQRMDKKRDAAANAAGADNVTPENVTAFSPAASPAAAPRPLAPEPAGPAAPAPLPLTPSATPAFAQAAAAPLPPQQPQQPPEPAARAARRHVELDLNHMRDSGMVTAAVGRTALVEDFRIIKRPLIKKALAERAPGERPGNLIMITSSLPGEGKTYCAINLAMSIAMELDHTVLLVDADVARPSVLRVLGLPAQRGLMDLLLDEKLDMSEVMLRTNVDTLSILSAGTSNARATELLASKTMSDFVNEIANRYPDRIVIFDSPPLLLTSEAHVLASHMGQIVVVVEAETTTQHAVQESLRQLEGCSNVNLIYNKTREFPGVEETYDYHYS